MSTPALKIVSEQPETVTDQIAKACNEWRAFKHAEDVAKENRVRAEQSIIDLMQFNKLEGSTTEKRGDYKISLTAKLDRKLDEGAYNDIADQLPENMRPVKTKTELDLKGIKWLEENAPEFYALVAPCITTKPAKTAVKVEFVGGV